MLKYYSQNYLGSRSNSMTGISSEDVLAALNRLRIVNILRALIER